MDLDFATNDRLKNESSSLTLLIRKTIVIMKQQIILEVICFLIIVLFVYTSVNKMIDFNEFRAQIGQSPILTPFSQYLAFMVPLLELGIASFLMIPRFRLVGLYGAFSLMTMFTAYIVIILNFSPFVPCSCGGVIELLTWREHLVFNIGFLLLSLGGILIQSQFIQREHIYGHLKNERI